MHLLPFYCNFYVNSFRDCQSDQFGEEFVKAFWRNPQNWFLVYTAQSTSKYKSVYKEKHQEKILSEVAIFKMDVIKSYHVNYYQCQLGYQGWKNCKLVGGFNDRKDRR